MSRGSRTGVTQPTDSFTVSIGIILSRNLRLSTHGVHKTTPEQNDDWRSLTDNGTSIEGDELPTDDGENPQTPPIKEGIMEYLDVRPRAARLTI